MRICLHGQWYERDDSEKWRQTIIAMGRGNDEGKKNFFCCKIQMHFIKKDNLHFYIHHYYCREFHNCISISQSSWNWILILPKFSLFWISTPKDLAGRTFVSKMVSCPVTVITGGFARVFPRFNFGLLPRFHHLTFPSLKTQSLQTTFPLPIL